MPRKSKKHISASSTTTALPTADLEKQLCRSRSSAWQRYSDDDRAALDAVCDAYRECIGRCKTERQMIAWAEAEARARGFVPLAELKKPKAGDKVFLCNRGKNLVLAVLGAAPLSEGFGVTASHVDAPRLDLKPAPLLEDGPSGTAIFKTHYYGGIKKYQWVQTPLSLIGVVALKDGRVIDVCIGEDPADPVFVIPDLLPHLAGNSQAKKSMPEVIVGEQLNLLVGSVPVTAEEVKEKVKMTVLMHLNQRYGIDENDFYSAELQATPAVQPRDVGLDRGILGAYGHDDRVCAFANLWGLFNLDGVPRRTALVFLADKEEVGSYGATGMDSSFFYHAVSRIARALDPKSDELAVRELLAASHALSTDVTAAVDPNFKEVHELNNAPKLGFGAALMKYTGRAGKAGSSDADAEYVALLRRLFDEHNIPWQIGELGKVDEGGGGTVAFLLARHLINTIDLGVPLVGMHSPFELASKADIYATARACQVFFRYL